MVLPKEVQHTSKAGIHRTCDEEIKCRLWESNVQTVKMRTLDDPDCIMADVDYFVTVTFALAHIPGHENGKTSTQFNCELLQKNCLQISYQVADREGKTKELPMYQMYPEEPADFFQHPRQDRKYEVKFIFNIQPVEM